MHLFAVVRHAPEQKSDQVLPPAGPGFFLFFKALRIPREILQNGTYGIQRHRRHVVRGTGLHGAEGGDQFVQLLRREPQGDLAEPPRNGTGIIRLARLQTAEHLHRDLVPLVHPEDRRDLHQRPAGSVPHQHILSYLDHVGKVGGDVEGVGVVSVHHLVLQKADVHHLLHPGRVGLQVVEEDVRHHVLLVQDLFLLRGVQSHVPENTALHKGVEDGTVRRHGGNSVADLVPHRDVL